MAKTPKNTTALAKWDDELAAYAQKAADAEQAPSGNFISFQGGQLSVGGAAVEGNKADIIVFHSIYENKFYEGKYNPDKPQPPVCYAFADEEGELKPHEKCAKPQHETCKGCPHNEFGSAETGKGKACKNIRRLGLLPASIADTPEGVKEGEMFFASLPVTSCKLWAGYVKATAAIMKRPPFGVITHMAVVPDKKSQFKVTFSDPRPLPDELMPAVMERRKEVMESIAAPYPEPHADEEEEAPAKGKKARKF